MADRPLHRYTCPGNGEVITDETAWAVWPIDKPRPKNPLNASGVRIYCDPCSAELVQPPQYSYDEESAKPKRQRAKLDTWDLPPWYADQEQREGDGQYGAKSWFGNR